MSVAVVSGAASGIGAAVRKRLEADGARVVGVDLRSAEVVADLGDAEARQRAVREVREQVGERLDRLVCCAGIGAHVDELALIPSVNFFGALAFLDGLEDLLAAAEAPAAVLIGSNSSQYLPFEDGPPAAYVEALLAGDEATARRLAAESNGFVAYAGSKHALARAVRHRARALGTRGVRANVVAPGPVETPLYEESRRHPVFGKGVDQVEIPLGRRGQPEEVAGLVHFLLSPAAAWMHGSVVFVDGGNDAVVRPDRF